ncbi:transcription initiation factor TFIID subunit 5-like [Drosophila miranda]|uniref:transcription initiation factor TFIID subunit 5-like n=1 Tax=Drosophila miranda TaxID=7229 RepID=UPI0007E7C177|nr:transcription initiation factor TFIID subunit 5-like [Drosophila miranda]XP_033249562.1 transcription initiation factor TFIID subunit 5-like [Drosophila miranda]
MSESEMIKQPKEENATGSTGEESLKATFVAVSVLHVGGEAICASLSEDTSLLAVARADCSVHVLRLKLHVSGAKADWTHGKTTTLSGHQATVYLGSFSTDGSQLLTCSADFGMRMWNVQSGRCLAFCRQTTSFIRGIAFISYASSYATVEDVGYASIWRADGEKIVCTKRVFQEQELKVCIFHPKKKYVVSGSTSSKVRIWDPAWDRYTTDLIDFNSTAITALAFTSCGSYMAAGVAEGQVILRNMNSKLVVCIFHQHAAAITSMAFDRDNFRLAVGSRDAKMSVWEFGAPAMESRASDCGRVLKVSFVSDSHLVGICVDGEESNPLALKAPTGSSSPRDFF